MDQVQSALRQQGPRITPQALLSKVCVYVYVCVRACVCACMRVLALVRVQVKQWFAGEVSQQVKASHAKFTLREDDQETAALCV